MTGSVRGGREILAAAENIVPVSLELGGKAPFVVLPRVLGVIKVVATFDNTRRCGRQSDNALKVHFSATLGEELEVEISLV